MVEQVQSAVQAFTDKANLIGGAVLAALTGLFGKSWPVFAFFFMLNAADYYYGRKKAKKTQTLSSKVGAEGIGKKVSYWVMIMLAFGVSYIFVELLGPSIGINLSFMTLIGWFTMAVYILNELTSIVENMLVLGYNVPAILVKGLAAARSAVDEAGNKVIPGEEKK